MARRTRMDAYEQRARAVKLGRTYLAKAVDMHRAMRDFDQDPWFETLLEDVLAAALDILTMLPDEFFAEQRVQNFLGLRADLIDNTYNASDAAQEYVEGIVAKLAERRGVAKRQKRIEMLENVAGRTPEEAEAYLAKAKEMRRHASPQR